MSSSRLATAAEPSTSSTSSTDTSLQLILSLRHHLSQEDDNDDDDKIKKIRLILASQSPRRKEILDMMGLQGLFDVMPSPLNESALQRSLADLPPLQYTQTLAEQKAQALADQLAAAESSQSSRPPILILGSDTIVELEGRILEKPKDAADAKRMLSALSGQCHFVHTGVALYKVVESISTLQASFVDTSLVEFAELSDADIDAYIATNEPMDKAGSYGIQGIGGQLVKRIQGDFFTVRRQNHVCRVDCRSALMTQKRLSP